MTRVRHCSSGNVHDCAGVEKDTMACNTLACPGKGMRSFSTVSKSQMFPCVHAVPISAPCFGKSKYIMSIINKATCVRCHTDTCSSYTFALFIKLQ